MKKFLRIIWIKLFLIWQVLKPPLQKLALGRFFFNSTKWLKAYETGYPIFINNFLKPERMVCSKCQYCSSLKRCKLSESTVVNQRNRNKEWWEIRLHGLKYEHRDSKWFAFCNSITFTKRQVSHRWSPDCEYKKRWKFHASSRQRSSILILSVCHKFRVDHLHSIMD